jgi:hypothetical protein
MLSHITSICMGIVLAVSAVTPGWAENSDFSGQVKKSVRETIDTR